MLTESDFVTDHWVGCGGLHMVQPCEAIISAALPSAETVRLLDAGCGCGAIGLSLLSSGAASELVMMDIDPASVNFAVVNTQRLLTGARRESVRTYLSDGWQAGTELLPEQPFDVIVCNAPMSAQPPADATVNPFRFWTDNWDFQRKLFSHLSTYLRPQGIVIIKDLFGSMWWRDLPVRCVLTAVGDAPSLQSSSQLFTVQGGEVRGQQVFPTKSVAVGNMHHCLRVFQLEA